MAFVITATIAAMLTIYQYGRSHRPRIVLWSWERPENLEFIDPSVVAVAFLAQTIRLRADEVIVKPRLQPLRFAAATELIAVVRVETEQPALSHEQLERAVSAIGRLVQPGKVSAIQIDFDARESERPFYRELLQALRRQLPEKTRLSITALASWCIHDDWLTGLPVDEAVPMLFRLGVERDEVRDYVASGKAFRGGLCQNSVGISTDEPLPRLPAMRGYNIYAFNPRPWSAATVDQILREWRP